MLTSGLTISYLRPAEGAVLRVEAVAEHATTLQVLSCDVIAVAAGDSEQVVAAAQGHLRGTARA